MLTSPANEILNGKPMDVREIAGNFALYGLKRRVTMLENLDAELRGEVDFSWQSLRRRVQLMALRNERGGVHKALRKAKR